MSRGTDYTKKESFMNRFFGLLHRSKSLPASCLPDGYVCPIRKAVLVKYAIGREFSRMEWVSLQSHCVVELIYEFTPGMRSSKIATLEDRIGALESELDRLRISGEKTKVLKANTA